jgi:uncharacterized protein with NRDE domain
MHAVIHGGANGTIRPVPWPKVQRTKQAFARWCAKGNDADAAKGVEIMFDMLADSVRAPDAELPVRA